MRLGTSGFGVIAVVSILVTAAPERKNGVGNDRGSDIDRTGGTDTERGKLSRRHYSGGYRVATKSDGFDGVASTRFVKKELTRGREIGRTWPEARTSHPSGSSTVRHNDLNIEAPTAPSRSTTDSRKLARTLGKAINFAGSAARRRVNSELIEAVASSSPRNCEKKFHVTLDSPISDFIRIVPTLVVPGSRLRRHGEWETRMDEGETKSRDDDKISTTWENGSVRTRGERSSTVESTVTSTSIGRIAMGSTRPISNFIESKEHRAARDELDVVNKKEAIGNDLFVNSRSSIHPIFQLESRINPLELEDVSSPSYSTNYPESLVPLRFSIWNEVSLRETRENREDRGAKDTFAAYTKANDSTKLPSDEYFMRDGVANGPRQESLVGGTITTYEDKGSTARSSIDGTALRSETLDRSSVTEEIGDARQITSGWFVEVSGIATNASRVTGNVGNASDVDNTGSVNNHKAIRAGSFKATERLKPSSSFSSRSSRIPERQGVKDAFAHLAKETPGVKTNRTTATVNQIAFPKSSFPVTKNATKQSINLVDGRVNKIFYEIKPSLITDMDRGDDIDVTTTTRRSVDRFLPPSVPSALGKFGPYFLDEEDRRNVTERIGNTVQLDCRIGLLGHRKVTWLQHYKDSFRLLTVERESYSVDRRISLNFQYPDNWRLQIAYASMRDSGLYKCQVEIDHARSLVKCYNVTITAPILTITDDSGRPVSGERHLKAGSTLKLRCEARDVVQRLNESVLWMRGDETLTDDVSENKTTEIVNENEVTVVISTLLVERAIPRHAGNYSCVVPDKARTTIAVHVLNGELPAAVQHGSGVSTAVLNLWLIHLTASYGFFR